MEYRSREGVLYQILTALSTSKTRLQTHLMYDCRLSSTQLRNYTEYMEKNELIKRVETVYSITPKGRELLALLEKLFSFKLVL